MEAAVDQGDMVVWCEGRDGVIGHPLGAGGGARGVRGLRGKGVLHCKSVLDHLDAENPLCATEILPCIMFTPYNAEIVFI